ncbi:MAG: SPOR domain-containing protein [Microscillaceae bacterium]|nr:SPOR domain-containing protein [Microscillaceae bacterium]
MPSDLKDISLHLYEWFQDHDSLVVPELGRFEAHYQSAKIQPTINKVLPPNKKILFDPNIKHPDRTFAEFIALQDRRTVAQAEQTIRAFVNMVKAELGIHKELSLEPFGKMFWTPSGQISFQDNEELVYAGESFGLPDLYNLKPNLQATSAASVYPGNQTLPHLEEGQDSFDNLFDGESGEEMIVEEEIVQNQSRWWFTALVTFLLLVIVSAIVLLVFDKNPLAGLLGGGPETSNTNTEIKPLNTDEILRATDPSENTDPGNLPEKETQTPPPTANPQDSRENPPNPATKTPTTPRPTPKIENPGYDYQPDRSFSASFVKMPQAPANLTEVLVQAPSGKHYIILGSFSSTENAYSFVNNLKNRGYTQSRIIAPFAGSPTYRVAYQGFDTRAEAREKGRAFGRQHRVEYFILEY